MMVDDRVDDFCVDDETEVDSTAVVVVEVVEDVGTTADVVSGGMEVTVLVGVDAVVVDGRTVLVVEGGVEELVEGEMLVGVVVVIEDLEVVVVEVDGEDRCVVKGVVDECRIVVVGGVKVTVLLGVDVVVVDGTDVVVDDNVVWLVVVDDEGICVAENVVEEPFVAETLDEGTAIVEVVESVEVEGVGVSVVDVWSGDDDEIIVGKVFAESFVWIVDEEVDVDDF
uniref:Uncharacterized protein n=1 Tax=Panagrolaimus davidi TaxID=227884 RepID=A0A914P975_9BILA